MSVTCLRFGDDIDTTNDVYYMINCNNNIFKIHLNCSDNKLLNIMDTIMNRLRNNIWLSLLNSDNMHQTKINIVMHIKYIIKLLKPLEVDKYLNLLYKTNYVFNIYCINDSDHWMNV